MMGLDLYEANGVDANTWIVPILGTKRLYRLEENNAAADVQRSAEHLNAIRAGADRIAIVCARYPEHLDRLTKR